jgi:uncharacterized protein YegL
LIETFNVNLSNATNATIADSQGVGTILDNDDPPRFIVGSNEDDVSGSTTGHEVANPPSTGPIQGGSGADILVGDVGGRDTTITPGKDYNIALVVDVSGSMAGSRLTILKDAINHLADQLAGHTGHINLTLISFANGAQQKTSILDFGLGQLADLKAIVNGLTASGATNYEAAFNAATNWFNGTTISTDHNAGYENLTFFITDGDPTRYNNDAGEPVGPGDDTDYATMANSVAAFQPLDDISKVFGIGVGTGVNSDYLRFFDNTDTTGPGSVSFGFNTLANFSGGSGINNESNWILTGVGERAVSGGYLRIEDDRGNSGATTVTLDTDTAITVAAGAKLAFDYRTANFSSGNDTFTWQLVRLEGGAWQAVSGESGTITTATSSFTPVTTGPLAAGEYGFAFTVFDGSGVNTANDAEVRIDNIRVEQVVTGPVGEAQIVLTGEELTAALVGDGEESFLLPAGNDVINGGDGNDIIFGDVLNTDALAGPSDPDGLGWQVFADLEAGDSGWSRADTLAYLNDPANHATLAQESLDSDGNGRTGGNDIINGGAGNDIIFGQEGDDRITGGLGDDLLSGGSGNDTFIWNAGETGTDTIIDFEDTLGPGGDVLHLSDLLQGEESAPDLSGYIQVNSAGGNTTLAIDASGGNDFIAPDQTIVLQGVTADLASLLTNGSIVTDHTP